MSNYFDLRYFATEYGSGECDCDRCASIDAGTEIARGRTLDSLVNKVRRQIPDDAEWCWYREPQNFHDTETLAEITHPTEIHGYIEIRRELR